MIVQVNHINKNASKKNELGRLCTLRNIFIFSLLAIIVFFDLKCFFFLLRSMQL